MIKIIIHGKSAQIFAGTLTEQQYNFWKLKSTMELFENLTCGAPGCQQDGIYNLGGNLKKISNLVNGTFSVLDNNTQLITENYEILNINNIKKTIQHNIKDKYFFTYLIFGNSINEFFIDDITVDFTNLDFIYSTINNLNILTNIKYKNKEILFSETFSNYLSSGIELLKT
jgi:hypothetical protein